MTKFFLFLSTFLLLLPTALLAQWDFSQHAIPLADIQSGGPPKDGIPALSEPDYLPAGEADFMRPDEQVIGVNLNGVARAYPLRILSWHELVNDHFAELPVLVSW
jgi:hypothetical protein